MPLILNNFDNDKGDSLRIFMKRMRSEYGIERCNKGYNVLKYYINANRIDSDLHSIYALVTIMILSSIFGKSGFTEVQIVEKCTMMKIKYSNAMIYDILGKLCSDRTFVNMLLIPSIEM